MNTWAQVSAYLSPSPLKLFPLLLSMALCIPFVLRLLWLYPLYSPLPTPLPPPRPLIVRVPGGLFLSSLFSLYTFSLGMLIHSRPSKPSICWWLPEFYLQSNLTSELQCLFPCSLVYLPVFPNQVTMAMSLLFLESKPGYNSTSKIYLNPSAFLLSPLLPLWYIPPLSFSRTTAIPWLVSLFPLLPPTIYFPFDSQRDFVGCKQTFISMAWHLPHCKMRTCFYVWPPARLEVSLRHDLTLTLQRLEHWVHLLKKEIHRELSFQITKRSTFRSS